MTNPQDQIARETLLRMLEELKATGQPAALFVDDGGLSSENGLVTEMSGTGDAIQVHLDNGKSFPLKKIMAVNGVFLTGFSTC